MSTSARALALSGNGVRKGASTSSKVWADTLKLASSPDIVADLGQGWPDLPAPQWASKVASDVVLHNPRLNQYSAANGLAKLRQNVSNHFAARYPNIPQLCSDTQVAITTSATEALYAAAYCVADPGDEVIIFEPFFPWYLPILRMLGVQPVVVTMRAPKFEFDINATREKITPRTKAIIVNSPHNPTGHVITETEARDLAALCVEHDLCCISDEVYEDTIFANGESHVRMTDQVDMKNRTITIGSASKKLALTGWRVGWVYGENIDLIGAVKTAHSYITYCAPTPFQEAVAEALDPSREVQLNQLLQRNCEVIAANVAVLGGALEKVGAKIVTPQGGHFVIADVRDSGLTATAFCEKLAIDNKVIGIPLSVFYSDESDADNQYLVRFAICKTEALIQLAAEMIQKVDH